MRRFLACSVTAACLLAIPSQAAAQYDLPRKANLRVSVTKPAGSLSAGVRYIWRIKVRNAGDATARQVVVRVRWSGLHGVSGGKVEAKAQRSTYRFARLRAGRSRTLRLSGVVAAGAKRVSVRAGATWR